MTEEFFHGRVLIGATGGKTGNGMIRHRSHPSEKRCGRDFQDGVIFDVHARIGPVGKGASLDLPIGDDVEVLAAGEATGDSVGAVPPDGRHHGVGALDVFAELLERFRLGRGQHPFGMGVGAGGDVVGVVHHAAPTVIEHAEEPIARHQVEILASHGDGHRIRQAVRLAGSHRRHDAVGLLLESLEGNHGKDIPQLA